MVENNIRQTLWKKSVTQADIVRKLPDVNAVQFSAITAGNVLPTRGTMEVICQVLDCRPTDLYDRADLILTGEDEPTPIQEAEVHGRPAPAPAAEKEDHEGMERFRVWMRPEEKETLTRACTILGYRSTSEWFREAYREALNRCATIANALPQQTEIAAAAGAEHYTIADIPHRLLSISLVKL